MKIYLVINEWTFEDTNGVVTAAFDTLDKACAEANAWIEEEKGECWAQAFDENGEIVDGYKIERTLFGWEIWEDGYYAVSHTRIEVRELEVM